MSPAQKFCLRWNDFENKFSSAFQDLRENKDFFDVTLACDDQQIEAHKVIILPNCICICVFLFFQLPGGSLRLLPPLSQPPCQTPPSPPTPLPKGDEH